MNTNSQYTLNDIYDKFCIKNKYYNDYLIEKCNLISTYNFDTKKTQTIDEVDQEMLTSINNLIKSLNKTKSNFKFKKDRNWSIINPTKTWLSAIQDVRTDLNRVCTRVINGTSEDIDNATAFYNFYMIHLAGIKGVTDLTDKLLTDILMSFNMLYRIFYRIDLIDETNPINREILRKILSSSVILDTSSIDPSEKLIYNKINYILSLLFIFMQQKTIAFTTYVDQINVRLNTEKSISEYKYETTNILDIKNKKMISVASYLLKDVMYDNIIQPCSLFITIPIIQNESEMKFLDQIDMMFDLVPVMSEEIKKFIENNPKTGKSFDLWGKNIDQQIKLLVELYKIMLAFKADQIKGNPLYNPLRPISLQESPQNKGKSPRNNKLAYLRGLFGMPSSVSSTRSRSRSHSESRSNSQKRSKPSPIGGSKHKYNKLKRRVTKKNKY